MVINCSANINFSHLSVSEIFGYFFNYALSISFLSSLQYLTSYSEALQHLLLIMLSLLVISYLLHSCHVYYGNFNLERFLPNCSLYPFLYTSCLYMCLTLHCSLFSFKPASVSASLYNARHIHLGLILTVPHSTLLAIFTHVFCKFWSCLILPTLSSQFGWERQQH